MKTLIIAFAIMMIGSVAYAAGFSEDFDDGLAQGMGDSDYGWPPGMVPIDGSDPLANPVRNIIYENGVLVTNNPSPGAGDWPSWSAGEDGAARTSPSEEAWVLNKLGFGTYTMDIVYEEFTGPNPCEKRAQIVLFASHPTQNVTNTLKSGVLISVGHAGDWGLAVSGVLPTDPDDKLWSYDPGQGFPLPVVDYRPWNDGGLTMDQRHNLSVQIDLAATGLLSLSWKAQHQAAWTPIIANLDVSSYLIDWVGDPAVGFTPVGPGTSGYWGMGSGDAGYHLWDNLSYVPIPEPTIALLGLIALVIRRKK